MADLFRDWRSLALFAAALFCAAHAAARQDGEADADAPTKAARTVHSPQGSIAGKLTDLRSAPLGGATVIVRNLATGAETRTTTARNGSYRLTGLSAGEYTLEAESAQLGRGRLEGIYVAGGGYEVHVQAAMALEPMPVLASLPPPVASRPGIAAELSVITPPFVFVPVTPAEVDSLEELSAPGAIWSDLETRSEDPQFLFAVEPLWNLALSGHAGPGSINPAGSMAITVAAASAAQTTLAGIHPLIFPAQASQKRLDPASPIVVTTLTATELQSLPVTGRRWQDFVLDTPAAASSAGESQGFSLRGAGQQPPGTALDGAPTTLAFGGRGSSGPESTGQGSNGQGGSEQNGMGQAWVGGRASPVAEAAIREIQTSAGNAEAESMRAAGGQINIDTARGANGLHGQGFFFDRQNAWGAQNPFTQWVKQTASGTLTSTPTFTPDPYTPPDHEAVWGFGAGSQIRRDKLFWFAALDSYHRNDPGLATVKHPDLFFAQPSNDQAQVLSARLDLSAANPVAEGLNAYSQMLSTLDGLLGPAPRTAGQWVGFGRIDWAATERQRLTLEATGALWNSPGGGLTRVSETYGAHSFGSSQASEYLFLGRWEAFLSPNLLAVTQGSLGRTLQSAHADVPSAYENSFLAANAWGQLPQIVVDSRYGLTIGNPSRFGEGSYPDEHVLQAGEGVDWVHHSLLVKSGFELSHNADATSLLRNQTGTYHYSSVENFASDAFVFAKYGLAGELNPYNQHDCDQTGKVWRDSAGTLHGLGYLPCYSYYSQVAGPDNWNLSTNDWATFTTMQWQPAKLLVISGGLRWEREQLPPPLASLSNPDLPLTQKLPGLGNNWGPRVSVALGSLENHWPVLRLGYGMYFGRTENATIETALTQTGSLKGDLNLFMRPTDNLNAGGAPPFPYVPRAAPGNIVKPGAVEFAPSFHNPEIHQAVAGVEEQLPSRIQVTASALVSLGRRLPISIDTNFDPAVNPGTITYNVIDAASAGPIKTPQITVPFYASWPSPHSPTGFVGRLNPNYQQVSQIMSRANSTYEAAVIRIDRYGRRGLSLHAHYTYAHAMDWNPNESTTVAGSDVLDPSGFKQEYGTGDLDLRHSAALIAVLEAPWKLDGKLGQAINGWRISGIGQYRSGLPFTMRTTGALAQEFEPASGTAIVALGPGMNGSGGDNRVYGVGRNTYRYPATWKADLRVGKKFDLGPMRQLELLVESFNLFNHQNVTEVESTGYYLEPGDPSGARPSLNFLTGLKANTTAFGQPLNVNAINFYRERQIQVGMRMRF